MTTPYCPSHSRRLSRNKDCGGRHRVLSYCKTKLSLYNRASMRPFRLIAGFLTVSLALGGVLGDFFHSQERSDTHAFAHSAEHTDSADMNGELHALDADVSSEGCYETETQVAIVSTGQNLSRVNVVGVVPTLVTDTIRCRRETTRTFSGRAPPLFEHASLFASTVSMRV